MAADDYWLQPELTFEETVERGGWFPAERASPVVVEDQGPLEFFGSAAHLGSGYILSARHVLEPAFAAGSPLVLIHDRTLDEKRRRPVAIAAWEPFPDPRVDLAVGLIEETVNPPFEMVGTAGPSVDLHCVGYPQDLVTDVAGELVFDTRHLRGYRTRQTTSGVGYDATPTIELSYAIPEGMSGSPVFIPKSIGPAILVGIARGNQESNLAVKESIHDDSPDTPKTIYRVTEYGLATMLSRFVQWEVGLADGLKLPRLLKSPAPSDPA